MKIEHFARYVIDLEAVKGFFVRYNAVSDNMYHNKKSDFKSYFLSFDDGSRLEIMTRPGLADEQKNPLQCGYIQIHPLY